MSLVSSTFHIFLFLLLKFVFLNTWYSGFTISHGSQVVFFTNVWPSIAYNLKGFFLFDSFHMVNKTSQIALPCQNEAIY